MDPNGVILTFHTIGGKKPTETTQAIHYAPFHYLGPFEPSTIRTVQVGANVALYGNILKQVNGVYVKDYLHVRPGKYTYMLPFQWLTMHADTISDKA